MFTNNNDIVVAYVSIGGFKESRTVSFKLIVEIYELCYEVDMRAAIV